MTAAGKSHLERDEEEVDEVMTPATHPNVPDVQSMKSSSHTPCLLICLFSSVERSIRNYALPMSWGFTTLILGLTYQRRTR